MKIFLLNSILFYQKYLSLDQGLLGKFLGNPQICIYNPTCSQYTYKAIEKYGIFKGMWLGLRRILRCHPFAKGGSDPLL